ncbi:hypothetical protein CHS0354_039437 [Potamilus streckersoni]|uniref:EF-hand domain-containing protein n=1 Tax=Potamilus streckersoni TaxID=2493646 RepID=A0AAE0S1Q4_9BIVA|nr:hypothetical protein CHS0354_039437 [Potamilus streckersoni]
MAAAAVLDNIHNSIRTLAQTKRIRVTEFFQDFDKLRSGFITVPQFFRCLWQTLGIKLSPDEENALIAKYDLKRSGQVNYKRFCNEIDQNFNPFDLVRDPTSQTITAPEFLGTVRSVRPLSPTSEARLIQLLQRMQQFYQYHGINLRTCYEDFDRHHMSVVTESQFYRSFPGPPDVNEADMHLLVMKYRDPDRPGLLNYLNLHHDIVAIGQQTAQDKELVFIGERNVDHIPPACTEDPALNQIFDKIRVAVFKNGVRTTEFFKDHDKLRSGIITENQFVCGLALAVGKEAQLSRAEIQKVVEYYRQPDGRVKYKEFCDMMENAFNIPDLEKKPLQDVVRPVKGALHRSLRGLSDSEEARIQEVLHEISDQVRRRRLMMYPYFKDYDRSTAYTRVVTKMQFARILHFLSLNVAPEDLKLVCAKFEDPASGDVNYPAFVQAVDQEFVGHTMDDADLRDKGRTNVNAPERPVSISDSNVSYEDLMARIRNIVLTKRLRVAEFFEDYDPLRSGSISCGQFQRGLGLLGLSKLGDHNLTDAQMKILCDVYQNKQKPDQVHWKQFVYDVETVFTQPNLEKVPTHEVPPSEIFRVPKPGTAMWENASEDHKQLHEATMERLHQRASQRRVLAKPVFQDFDRHNNGHVTKAQFRQCLTMLELHATEAEMIALEAKFCNDVGFNYIAFLQELQPQEPPKFMYEKRLENLRATNSRKRLPDMNPETDLEGLLLKIQTKVSRERIRVLEFMRDYDKLRSGRMLKTSFRRALDLCRFELKESEVCLLEDRYQSAKDNDYVDYLKFCDEIESIFTTKELEKAPLQDVVQFKPPEEWTLNKLDEESRQKFTDCMKRIAEKVRKHQMQLFPLFEDYDRVHNGTVSRSQFRRVLTELELSSLVSQQEFELLWKQFDVKIGGKDDVNYIAFCEMIYDLAKFEWRKP